MKDIKIDCKVFKDIEKATLYAIELDLKYGSSEIKWIRKNTWEVYHNGNN